MYTTSNEYKNANLEPNRSFESNITIGTRILTNEDVISFTIEQSIQQDDTFSVGNAVSSCLNLVFLHNDIDINDKDIVNLQLGLLVNESYEYIPLGIYNISSIDSNDTTTTLTCFDNMIKFDIGYIENNDNPTLYSIVNRLTELTGVEFGGILSGYKDYSLSVLEGYSCREVLGFIAGVLGANAIIDRTGKFDFVFISTEPIYLTEKVVLATKDGNIIMTKNSEVLELNAQTGFINADKYYDYTKKNKNYKIKKVINSTDLQELSLGTLDENSVYLGMENPFVNEEILRDIYSKMNGLEFLPYSLSWQGDLSINLGDLITVTDKKGITRAHPVLSQTLTYNGALNTILGAQGETKTLNEYTTTTSEENAVSRVSKKVVQVEKDAGELYVVVYDEENQSSVKLTEKMLEAIADTIQLTAKNINLEGLVTANNNFKILLDGSIEAVNGKFTGNITGSTITGGILLIGDKTNHNYFQIEEWGDFQAGSIDQYGKNTTLTFGNGQLNLSGYDSANEKVRFIGINGDGIEIDNCLYSQDYITPSNELLEILGSLSVEGDVTANSIEQTSDRRLKENIKYINNENLLSNITLNENITLDDMYKFMKEDFKLATYNYINNTKNKIGIIAQDALYNSDETYNKIGKLIVNEDKKGFLKYDLGNCMSVGFGALQKVIEKLEKIEEMLQMKEGGINE